MSLFHKHKWHLLDAKSYSYIDTHAILYCPCCGLRQFKEFRRIDVALVRSLYPLWPKVVCSCL